MPPLDKKQTQELPEYDAFYIGGGSGGLAAAVRSPVIVESVPRLTVGFALQRRAGSYGANVGLVEASYRLGGTCVYVGMSCIDRWNLQTPDRPGCRLRAQEDHVVYCRHGRQPPKGCCIRLRQ